MLPLRGVARHSVPTAGAAVLKDSAVYQRGNCVEAGPMVSLLLPYLARSRVVVGLVVPGSRLIHLA